MIYTLDTNVFIDALRQPAELESLKEFLNWALPQTALSSVVASELLAGTRTQAARRLVEIDLLGAFARRGRIVAPSSDAWVKTGISLGQSSDRTSGVLLQNDLLLAHTARELGWSLITRDKDFVRIRQQVKGLRVEPPYPRQPTRN